MPIRAAIFDLDDTLYDFLGLADNATRRVAARIERDYALPADDVFHAARRILREQRAQTLTAGYHSRTIRFQRLLEEHRLPLRNAIAYSTLYWEDILSAARPFDGVPEALDALRARGLRIGIGTNMTADWQLVKLERLGLIDRVDFMVSSEEAGVEKPDPGIFRLCADKAGCALADCLFVGDNLAYDVQGPIAAGMHGLWFQPDPAKRREHPDVPSFGAFSELPAITEDLP